MVSAVNWPHKARRACAGPMTPRTLSSAVNRLLRPLQRRLIRKLGKTSARSGISSKPVREDGFDVSAANTINRLYQTLLQYILAERGIYREEDLAVRIRELGEGK
jgi:hypothetical protein